MMHFARFFILIDGTLLSNCNILVKALTCVTYTILLVSNFCLMSVGSCLTCIFFTSLELVIQSDEVIIMLVLPSYPSLELYMNILDVVRLMHTIQYSLLYLLFIVSSVCLLHSIANKDYYID